MIRDLDHAVADAFANQVFASQEALALAAKDVTLEKGVFSLGAYVGGELAGVISAKQTWENSHITALAVRADHQGRGLGSQLLSAMENLAKQKGITTMTLSTKSYQAKDFYLKQGYQLFGQLEDVPLKGVTKYHFVKYL